MGLRRYDFSTCSVKRYSEVEVRWSIVQDTVEVYTDIPCSYWKAKASNFWGTALATQSDTNALEMNFSPEYELFQGDIIVLRGKDYKIQDVIPHPNHTGEIDNLQVFIIPSKDD